MIETEGGHAQQTLPYQFDFPGIGIIYGGDFKVLRYLDPYGDTTFNKLMFADLIADLTLLKERLPAHSIQIEDVLAFASECQNEVHTYLKFYGD